MHMKYIRTYNEEINYRKLLTGAALGASLALSNPAKADTPKDSTNIDNPITGNVMIDFVNKLDLKYGNSLYDTMRPISFLKNELNDYDKNLKLRESINMIQSQPNFPLSINLFYVVTNKQVPILTFNYTYSDKVQFTFTRNEAWGRSLAGLNYKF